MLPQARPVRSAVNLNLRLCCIVISKRAGGKTQRGLGVALGRQGQHADAITACNWILANTCKTGHSYQPGVCLQAGGGLGALRRW